MSKFTNILFLCICFVFYANAYEVKQDDEYIKFKQTYTDNTQIELSFTCASNGGEPIADVLTNFNIELGTPIDMRRSRREHFKVYVGGYDACRQESYEIGRYCENLAYDLTSNRNVFKFAISSPKIEIKKIIEGQHYTTTGYDKLCTEGFEKDEYYNCVKVENVASFPVDWFKRAHEEAKNMCITHRDKISTHIKRILGW